LDSNTKSFINLQISAYAENSLKCSAFAYKDSTFYDGLEVRDLGNSGDFIFVGLVGMSDDIREDALSSIHNL